MADSETTTTTTGPSNKRVNKTLNKLLGGINDAYDAGSSVFDRSTYVGPSDETRNAWAMSTGAASAPWFKTGVDTATGFNNDLLSRGGLTAGQRGAMGTASDATAGYGNIFDEAGNPSLTEDTLMDVARGKYLTETDPNFQAMIDRQANRTAADINASMGANGRYGSNVHVGALGEEIGALRTGAAVQERNMQLGRQMDALSAIEGRRDAGTATRLSALSGQLGGAGQLYGMEQGGIDNSQQAAAMLPQLFSTAQLPASVYGAVGAAKDADATAKVLGEKDLFDRTANADLDLLTRLSAILGGTAGVSPTTTTSTQPTTPWWQTLAGLGLGALSLA